MDRRVLFLALFAISVQLGLSSVPRSRSKGTTSELRLREQYLSKSYGEIQFNKYKGQLPPKGSILSCAIRCMTLTSCHCLALNIHTAECTFFDMDDSPDYSKWGSAVNETAGAQEMLQNNETNGVKSSGENYTNADYIFFTRDILDPNKPAKLDVLSGRRIVTSFVLEPATSSLPSTAAFTTRRPEGRNNKSNGKNKSSKVKATLKKTTGKSAQNAIGSVNQTALQFPLPWIQIEFKESMYLTEVALITTRAIDDLKHFQIRVGDEPIGEFYKGWTPGAEAVPFEANSLCFEYSSKSKGFFESGATRKLSSFVKSIKCRPCGLKGRFLTIQAMAPCSNCRSVNEESRLVKSPKSDSTSTEGQFPLAISSLEVYGYPL